MPDLEVLSYGTKIMAIGTRTVVFFLTWVQSFWQLTSAQEKIVAYKYLTKVISWVESIISWKESKLAQILRGTSTAKHNQVHSFLSFQRLKEAMKVCPRIYVEMNTGDALFFHCNLLHASDQNLSEDRRWVMITSYNKRKNGPVYKHHHSLYHPLNILPNSAILECEVNKSSTIDKKFMNPNDDKSHK